MDLAQVLNAFLSGDNALRKQAEALYAQEATNPASLLQRLFAYYGERSLDVSARLLCGVLLRRLIEKSLHMLPADMIASFQSGLLAVWSSETDSKLLANLSHLISQVAYTIAQPPINGNWTQLIPAVAAETAQMSDLSKISASFKLIETLAEYRPDDITANISTLGGFLAPFLGHSDVNVQIASAKATASCITALDDEESRILFKPALQPIINVIGAALQQGFEIEATAIIDHLVAVAEIQPIFFRGAVETIVPIMLQIAGHKDFEFSTRSMALELLATLSQTAPALVRKCSSLVPGVVPLAFNMMLETDEDDDEFSRGKYSEELLDEDSLLGEEAIERLASTLGGRSICDTVLSCITQFSTSSSWQHRRAAIAGLQRLADGCSDYFKKHVFSKSLPYVLQACNDASSVRVQYQAIECVARFADLFPSEVPLLVNTFVPHLTAIIGNNATCPRVRGHATSAMISIIKLDECSGDVLAPHMQLLLQALVVCLQNASVEVQPPCLTLLGRVAEAAGQAFTPYYPSFMPSVKSILLSSVAPELATLRGKAMECAAYMGGAVDLNMFAPDAVEILALFTSFLQSDANNDITFEYILPACAKMSKAVGAHFEPYLPFVMNCLMASINEPIQCIVEDADEDEAEGEVANEDEDTKLVSTVISFGAAGKKKVTLNVFAVTQKNEASRILYELASNMKGLMKAHIVPAIAATIPLVTCQQSGDVRASSALALAQLFVAYIDAVKKGFVAWDYNVLLQVVSKFLANLQEEINPSTRSCVAEALSDVLLACYESGVEGVDGKYSSQICQPDTATVTTLVTTLLAVSQKTLLRMQEKREAFSRDEGMDQEDLEGLEKELEDDEDMMKNVVDSFGQLLKIFGEQFMQIFDAQIAPVFANYLAPSQPEGLQFMAVCLIDDVIEFGGASAHKYIPQCLQVFAANLRNSEHTVLKQPSAYGIAVASRVAPQVFAQSIEMMLQTILPIVSSPTAAARVDTDEEGTIENCLFTIGTICTNPVYRSITMPASCPTMAQLAQLWLGGLPLIADGIEAKTTQHDLCAALECNDQVILGANFSNLPVIIRVIADILVAHFVGDNQGGLTVHPATLPRLTAYVKGVLSNPAVAPVVSSLTATQQEVFQKI